MVRGLPKYAGEVVRQKASSPKLQVFDTALASVQAGRTFHEVRTDPEAWGRLVESAAGAHLVNAEAAGTCAVHYWRDRGREVDFVVTRGGRVTAIEVKSGAGIGSAAGRDAFHDAHHPDRTLLIGGDGIPLEQFLTTPVEHWLA